MARKKKYAIPDAPDGMSDRRVERREKRESATGFGPSIQLPEPWKRMAFEAGGVGKLAEELSVDPLTIQRWSSGKQRPGRLVRKVVNDWARERDIREPFPGG
jgi:hypothetical protein